MEINWIKIGPWEYEHVGVRAWPRSLSFMSINETDS